MGSYQESSWRRAQITRILARKNHILNIACSEQLFFIIWKLRTTYYFVENIFQHAEIELLNYEVPSFNSITGQIDVARKTIPAFYIGAGKFLDPHNEWLHPIKEFSLLLSLIGVVSLGYELFLREMTFREYKDALESLADIVVNREV